MNLGLHWELISRIQKEEERKEAKGEASGRRRAATVESSRGVWT